MADFHKNLKSELKKATEEKEAEVKEKEAAIAEKAAIEQQLADLEQSLTASQSQIATAVAEKEAVEQQLVDLEQSLTASKTPTATAVAEKAAIEQQLVASRDSLVASQAIIDRLNEEKGVMAAELVEIRALLDASQTVTEEKTKAVNENTETIVATPIAPPPLPATKSASATSTSFKTLDVSVSECKRKCIQQKGEGDEFSKNGDYLAAYKKYVEAYSYSLKVPSKGFQKISSETRNELKNNINKTFSNMLNNQVNADTPNYKDMVLGMSYADSSGLDVLSIYVSSHIVDSFDYLYTMLSQAGELLDVKQLSLDKGEYIINIILLNLARYQAKDFHLIESSEQAIEFLNKSSECFEVLKPDIIKITNLFSCSVKSISATNGIGLFDAPGLTFEQQIKKGKGALKPEDTKKRPVKVAKEDSNDVFNMMAKAMRERRTAIASVEEKNHSNVISSDQTDDDSDWSDNDARSGNSSQNNGSLK